MAYSAPPTFADNTAPTAANLTVLSDDVAYLESIRDKHDYPAIVCEMLDENWNVQGQRWRWQIIHQHDTLVIDYTIGGASHEAGPNFYFNGTDLTAYIVGGGDFSANQGTHSYVVDLSGLGLTVGNVYAIRAEIDSATSSTWVLNYMYEAGTQGTALPRQWAHGDVPTAAYMNAYSDGIEAIYDSWEGRKATNLLVPLTNVDATYDMWYGYANDFQIELTDYKFVRQYRWLHYYGEGSITDPANVNDAITLNDNDAAGGAVYDLEDSGWIVIGAAYTVAGVSGCIESDIVDA